MSSNLAGNKEYLAYLNSRRGTIRTAKGGWVIGKGISCHGYSMLDDLAGKASYFQVMLLDITGRMIDKKLADWMEVAFICLSWPDPRIWCNQVGSLGGASRATPVAAVSAGILASDSRMYGPGTALDVAEYFCRSVSRRADGESISEIVSSQRKAPGGTRSVPGFGRPVANGDERVEKMEEVSRRSGFETGPILDFAYEVQKYLLVETSETMNMAGYTVAFMLDAGFSEKEIYRIFSICVNSGVNACYSESFDNPPDAFLPLRCDDVEYIGKSDRPLLRTNEKN